MRSALGVVVAALLLLPGCGGNPTVPIASTPAERIPPGAPSRPQADAERGGRERARVDTIAAGDDGITDENLGSGEGPPDRADEKESRRDHDADASSGSGDGSPDGEKPEDAVYHILRHGQTLFSVSRAYGVRLDALLDANGITDPTKVPAGTPILIPGFRRSRSSEVDEDGTRTHLAWPLHGSITGAFGPRGKHSHHAGIDIDGDGGDPILAAASGTVLRAGVDGRYGRRIVLDHGDGLLTLYAHASRLLVQEGDEVRAGETIAEVGRSGNARGTHLHFEVRRDGRAVNPLPYLKAGDLLASAASTGKVPVKTKKPPRAKPATRPRGSTHHDTTPP